jgi:hypothetical protein
VEQKTTASMITKKMLSFMKEAEDMSVIGPTIKDQQKILVDCLAKKQALVKLQIDLIKQGGGGDGNKSQGKLQLTEEDRAILGRLVNEKDDINLGEDETNDDDKYKT